MNSSPTFHSCLVLTLAGFLFGPFASASGDTVGHPNILWRAKATGANKVWRMYAGAFVSETAIPATGDPDHNWRIAGVGDFDGNGAADILWQHEVLDAGAIWFMNGFEISSGQMLLRTGDTNWRMAAVADLNRDGKADILWQYRLTGQVAAWLMNGASPWHTAMLSSQPGSPDWRLVGAGDLNADGSSDLVWRHETTGQAAVWHMGGNLGLTLIGGALMSHTAPNWDWKICGVADFNGDELPDLLWRHTTLGANAVWLMNDHQLAGSAYLESLTDPGWKIASQDTRQSTWRQTKFLYSWLTANSTGSRVTLSYRMSGVHNGVTIQRREPPSKEWQTLATGWQPGVVDGNYSDASSQPGRLYEYKVFPDSSAWHERIFAGINVPSAEYESRGRIIVLIDRELAPYLDADLDTLKQDLIGDGWTVIEKIATRHNDATTTAADEENRKNRETIKQFIDSQFQTGGAQGVLIVGHVTIPYSGFSADDGHAYPATGDHQGAWIADMYYGDVESGLWTDSSVNYTLSSYAENWNVPGDGKFDNNWAPSDLELFVGRIDFSRLPSFHAGSLTSEADLMRQYLAKNHRYRHKRSPFPVRDRAITFATVGGDRADTADNSRLYAQAVVNSAALFGSSLDTLEAGDPFHQQIESYAFGFAGGKGGLDRINTEFAEANSYFLLHTSADLKNGVIDAPVVFYELLGSWFGDWNLRDSFMRAAIATPNYGLASTWSRYSKWRFYPLAMGFPLGQCLLSTANDAEDVSGRYRYLSIIGDPTLRLHALAPPTQLTGAALSNSSVRLTWAQGEHGCKYHVYRASSLTAPFQRISANLVDGTTFTDASAPPPGKRIYMVRAVKTTASGSGSYENISQGVFW